MSSDSLQPIRAALKAGDKPAAQTLLRPLLKDHPSAEVWYLAAQACPTDEKAIACLRRALDLEPQHNGANRLLFRLEGAKPLAEQVESPKVELSREEIKALGKAKPRRKHTGRRLIILLGILLLGSSCSLITFNLVGLIHGPITVLTQLTGGGNPTTQIEGTPLAQVPNAVLKVPVTQSKPLNHRDTDVLEPGYAHQFTFSGQTKTEVAIYIQFLSVAANRVSRNVALLRPDDSDATTLCQRDTILQGDNNITLTCPLDTSGVWKVKVLGREGESVGAYFVGVEQIQS